MESILKALFWLVLFSLLCVVIYSINRSIRKRICTFALNKYLDIDEVEYSKAMSSPDSWDLGILILAKLQEKGRLLVFREISFLKNIATRDAFEGWVDCDASSEIRYLENQLMQDDRVDREKGLVFLCIPYMLLLLVASPCIRNEKCRNPFCEEHLDSKTDENCALVSKMKELDRDVFYYHLALHNATVVFPDVVFFEHCENEN